MNRFDSPALRAWILVAAGAFLAPGSLFAVDHEVRILMDLDNNAATGCLVATVDGPFDGVEQILITTVETTSPPPAGTVIDVATSDCINPATDTFGPPASFDGGWPIGLDNGEGGLDVVETYFPLLSSVVPDPKIIRVAVVVTDELGGEQALLTEDGTPDGPAILVDLRLLLEIPTLGEWGLILLALLLAGGSIVLLGRRGAVAAALAFVLLGVGLAWAAPGLDGLIDDWFLQDRVAGNGMVLWAKKVGNDLCFRVDLELLFNTSPTADPQAVTTDEDTSVAITLTGSDPESDPLTFTIVPGSGPANGTLTGTPPNVTYDPDPDYNGPDSFDFQVEDPSGATDTATVSITVTDENDAPVVDPATFGLAENSPNGTSVGTVTFTDVDTGQSHTFAITAGNTGGAFAIDPTTGEITVATPAAVDFETNPTFNLTVEVTDDGAPPLTGSATVTVDLGDVNDPPAVADQAFSVDENAANGTSAGTVAASDEDLPAQTLTFAITAGNTDGAFAIDPSTGEITVANSAALDAETNPSFSLTVQVTDDGAPNESSTATVTVTVNDLNEAPVADDATFSVDENAADGTSVGTVTFTDPDAGQTHTFAITAGNTGGAFAIDATTGEITVASSAAVDFETNPTFSLTVEVTDNGAPPLSDTATITINVNDLNEAPVADDATFSVDENAANGTSVGTVTFTDDDPGQTHTLAITAGNTGGAFAINASTGEITVASSAAVDFETNPTFSLTVEVTDDGSPALSDTATITINVNDQNEAPVANDASASIDENEPNGTSVVTVTFTDDDVGQSHTFAITAGNTGGAFAIDANTGEITVATSTAVDFETNPSFTLTVEVTDDGSPVLSDTATVSITVNDVNEAPEANDATFSVNENSANGTSVGTVTFTDDDTGQTHSFLIIGGNTGGAFAINASTGEITVATSAAVDFEVNPSFSLTVQVTDDGTPSLSDTATVSITVNDVNEAPTAVDDPVATDEDTPITILVLGNDTDPDAGDTLTIISVTASTGAVINNGTDLSYDPTAAFNSLPQGGSAIDSFTYTIEDSGGLQSTATVTVTVGGLNDDPVADDETYSAVGNTQLAVEKVGPFAEPTYVSSLAGVLDGDVDPDTGDSVSAVAFSGDPAGAPAGDFLDLAADGSFFYTPAPGHTAPTTFDYTVQDTFGGTDTGTVTINIAKMVWYVDNTANGGAVNTGAGTSTDPFSTLSDGAGNSAADDAEDASAAGHILYVFQGSGTTNMDQGIALKNQQKLWGEGVSLIVDIDDGGPEAPQTLFTGNAANKPHVTRTGAGDAVNVLADTTNGNRVDIEILGLQLSSSAGNAIDVTSANAANLGVTIAENNISGAGAEGVDVNAGSTSTTQTLGIHENAFQATGPALDVTRTAGTVTITSFHDNTVSGDSAGAGLVVNGPVTFDASTTAGIQAVPGGTTVIGQPGNRIGGAGLSLTSVTGALNFANLASGTIGVGDLDIYTDSGAALSVSGTGGFDLDVTPNAGTLEANAGAAAILSGLDADLQLNMLTSNNSGAQGVSLTSVTGTFSAPTGSSITNATGTDFVIASSSAAVTYNGTITDDVGQLVSVSSSGGSPKLFTGAITDGDDGDGSGISLTGNSSTIRFSGGVVLSTGTNPAFTATGGGTVEVCDENPCNPGATGLNVNKITTTTGTALNVANTTIGANNLEFQSISSNGGSSNGIILNTTGSSGGLKVKGTGSAASGGTIQNKTGADGSTSTGIGIYLNQTSNVSLANMLLRDFQNYGIRGLQVSGFTMTSTDVDVSSFATNGTTVATDEGSVSFGVSGGANGLTGTATITDSLIRRGYEDNLSIFNSSGSLNLTIDNSVIRDTGSVEGNDGVIVRAAGTANITVDVRNSDFIANRGDHFQGTADDSAVLDVRFGTNGANTLTGGHATALGQSITINSGSFSGQVIFDVSNNSINGAIDTPINVNKGGGTGTFSGTIHGNTIGTSGVANSGTTGNKDAIRAVSNGAGSYKAVISDNVIKQVSGMGIFGIARDGSSAFDLTIVGNNLSEPAPGVNAIRVESGATSTDTVNTCADLGGANAALHNTVTGDWGAGIGADEIRIRHQFSATCTFRLPGFAGGTTTDVVNYLTARNNVVGGTISATIAGGGSYTGGAACAQP